MTERDEGVISDLFTNSQPTQNVSRSQELTQEFF